MLKKVEIVFENLDAVEVDPKNFSCTVRDITEHVRVQNGELFYNHVPKQVFFRITDPRNCLLPKLMREDQTRPPNEVAFDRLVEHDDVTRIELVAASGAYWSYQLMWSEEAQFEDPATQKKELYTLEDGTEVLDFKATYPAT
jgi:hypothetical protein